VSVDELERATGRLLELTARGEPRECTLLGVLAHELKVVSEAEVLRRSVEADGIGLVELRALEVPEELRKEFDPAECWATWTVPFDREAGITCLASAYHLSPAVRAHWEKRAGGTVLWYGTTLGDIAEHLARFASSGAA
jgi:hypothetical protein